VSLAIGPRVRDIQLMDRNAWVYGDYAPDPHSHDLLGLKARWILDRIPACPIPVVLDYGAGEGKHLHLVRKARPEATLVGVDVHAPQTAIDFEFHLVAPDEPLPFSHDRFDVVVSCDVLEHVNSVERSLDEIRRVLRPGGALIGFVPLEGGFGPHSFFRLIDRDIYRDTKDHKYAYRRREMLAWLSSRFRIIDLSYSYHLVGASLDAAFFASFKLPGIGQRLESFWRGQANVFYRGGRNGSGPSLIGRAARVANYIAYWESRLLSHVPLGASGLHFHLEKP
jgi:SAM-dependent methyltransferase